MDTVFHNLFNFTTLLAAENGGGIFFILGQIMSVVIRFFYDFIGDWGLAIVVLTVVIKVITFPFTAKSTRSMQKMQRDMQKVQPEMKKIQEKYKDDKATQQEKTMELYKKHNINPLGGCAGGCLPLLIQMPFLIGIFQAIHQMQELTGTSFLWIGDLGAPDIPLVVLTGISMYFQTSLQQKWSGTEATQQTKMMSYFMPIFIVFIGLNLPAGVFLYWFTSTGLQLLQQYIISQKDKGKEEEKEEGKKERKKESK